MAGSLATVGFVDKIGWDKDEIFGYTIIAISALMTFLGVRSYPHFLVILHPEMKNHAFG
jgi:hypothetical protein